MGRLISQKQFKARKDYHDDSSEFLRDCINDLYGLKFSEWRSIIALRDNNWKIKKGQIYIKQFNEQDGDVYTFRSLPEILAICLKYKLYAE